MKLHQSIEEQNASTNAINYGGGSAEGVKVEEKEETEMPLEKWGIKMKKIEMKVQ